MSVKIKHIGLESINAGRSKWNSNSETDRKMKDEHACTEK